MAFPEGLASRQGGLSKGVQLYFEKQIDLYKFINSIWGYIFLGTWMTLAAPSAQDDAGIYDWWVGHSWEEGVVEADPLGCRAPVGENKTISLTFMFNMWSDCPYIIYNNRHNSRL